MLSKAERQSITEAVLLGMKKLRYEDAGRQAYKFAEEKFTRHQLGALHRKMRECADELYEKDAEPC